MKQRPPPHHNEPTSMSNQNPTIIHPENQPLIKRIDYKNLYHLSIYIHERKKVFISASMLYMLCIFQFDSDSDSVAAISVDVGTAAAESTARV